MKVINGMKNLKYRYFAIGLLITIILIIIVYYKMDPGIIKFCCFFGLIPGYLFLIGNYNYRNSNYKLEDRHTINYDKNMINTNISHIERKITTTKTTTETIYFKEGGNYIE